jgi:hypothetical protein
MNVEGLLSPSAGGSDCTRKAASSRYPRTTCWSKYRLSTPTSSTPTKERSG